MKQLEIKLTGQQNLGDTFISIDDKPAKFKRNEFGNVVCKYQTENDKVNIKVYRMLDVGGIGWFITQLFFFIISIFGLLDIHRKEKCMIVDFESNVELKEQSKITLRLNTPQENGKAIDIETDLNAQEVSNKYYLDTQAMKTLKVLRLTKIILAIAIIVTIVVVLFVKL